MTPNTSNVPSAKASSADLRFSNIRPDMLKRYGGEFRAAAQEQAGIVKGYLA